MARRTTEPYWRYGEWRTTPRVAAMAVGIA